MSPRHLARLAALLAPAALMLPTAAHAEKVVTEDAVGDVMSLSESQDLADAVPAPDYAGVDVVRTAVAHGAQRLRVTVRFRSLERDPFQLTLIHISTPRGGYDVVVERLGGKPITSLGRGRKEVDCRGLKTTVDLGAETVTTSLPTSCIRAPRWVKVGVGAVAVSADQASPELAAAYADDAHRAGEIRDRIAPGPRVHRG